MNGGNPGIVGIGIVGNVNGACVVTGDSVVGGGVSVVDGWVVADWVVAGWVVGGWVVTGCVVSGGAVWVTVTGGGA